MFEQDVLKHHIQRQIVSTLMFNEYARFTDLCPPRIDTNLFSYHLKLLLKQDYVAKTEHGYTLSYKGLLYVDRMSSVKMKPRTQPKIITMLLLQNNSGEILIQKRSKQPYINTWTLPYGKIHIDDPSLVKAATREAEEKLGTYPNELNHLGDCYIRVARNGIIESTTLAHIVSVGVNSVGTSDRLRWVKSSDLPSLNLAPAVQEIVEQSLISDSLFFKEYTVSANQAIDASAS